MNTMATVSLRVHDSLIKQITRIEKRWQADRSEVVRRLLVKSLHEWRIEDALERLKEHKISIGKAAQESGLMLWDLLALAKERGIDWTDYSREDAEKDLAELRK